MTALPVLIDEDEIRAAYYVEQAYDLACQLPLDARDPFLEACATDVVSRRRPGAAGPKVRKPTGLTSPATRCMWLSGALRGFAMSTTLSPPIRSFAELAERTNIVRLLKGPLGSFGPRSQLIILRGIASIAERGLGLDVNHINRAVGRIQSRARLVMAPHIQRPFQDYWDIAHELAPYMEAGDPHILETALQSRYAATLGIALEIIPRRSELAGLMVSNVIIDLTHRIVDIVVPAYLRKNGDTYQVRLSPSIADLVIDYALYGRPYLIEHGGLDTDRFWVSSTGGPLCPEGIVETLRRQVRKVLGETASCLIFRRASASRSDVAENETFLRLHQGPGSRVGLEVYAQKNVGEAQRALFSAMNRILE